MDYDNSAMARAISECVHSDMRREILSRKLIDGWTYERIAEAVDRTPRQIGYILQREIPRVEKWYENCIRV